MVHQSSRFMECWDPWALRVCPILTPTSYLIVKLKTREFEKCEIISMPDVYILELTHNTMQTNSMTAFVPCSSGKERIDGLRLRFHRSSATKLTEKSFPATDRSSMMARFGGSSFPFPRKGEQVTRCTAQPISQDVLVLHIY